MSPLATDSTARCSLVRGGVLKHDTRPPKSKGPCVEPDDTIDLRDLLRVIRTRKWIIIAVTVLATALAVGYSLLQTPLYESEARVLITEKNAGATIVGAQGSEFSSQPERNLQIQVELMKGRPLLEDTIETLALDLTPEELADKVEVAAVGQTNVVPVKATDAKPQVAADIANTLAQAYVTWSREYNRESIRAAIEEIEPRLTQAKAEVIDLGKRIQGRGGSSELAAELEIATTNYTTLTQQLEQLKVSEQLEAGSGRVVSPAVVTKEPVSPKPMRNGALGLAIGLVVGLGVAFMREYLDTTLRSTDEIEEIYGAPVLGVIPHEKPKNGEKRELTIQHNPGSPAAEAYRGLRNSLDFINFEHSIKTLLVCSAEPAEGKSTVAANLATGLAQAGKRVTFVNCDFRRPTVDQFFKVTNMIGLADVLSGAHQLKSALQYPSQHPNLVVLTSGKLPPNPSEMLGSTRMQEVVETLAASADWVIVDSPPILAVADAGAVARWADGALVVIRANSSNRDAARKARETLEQVGAKVLGTVVWGLEGHTYGGGGYGYGGYGAYHAYSEVAASDEGRRRGKHGKAKPAKAK